MFCSSTKKIQLARLPEKLILALLAGTLCAGPGPVSASGANMMVIELFTSQGCYSCPPADVLLGELIHADRGIIGLEFHVDYWDDLSYGRAGIWKDPFSSPRYTDRQRKYSGRQLSGQRGIYTPQAVINGRYVTVGTNRSGIESALEAAARTGEVGISLRNKADQGFTVTLDGDANQRAAVWLMIFDRKRVTSVPRGENHGKTLKNHNVVREIKYIGDWLGQSTSISIDDIAITNDQGCAILVQSEDQGPILGATLC